MMTLPILLELAQQGDATAIAILMNAALKAEKIRVKVILDRDCLLVMLRALRPLNQHATIAFIRRGLLQLQPNTIRTVRVYAWHLSQDFPTWIAEFPIEQSILAQSSLQSSSALITSSDQLPASADPQPIVTPAPTKSVSSKPKPQRFRFSFLVVLIVLVYMAVTIA